MENASYGITVCAERTAVANAVASEGPKMRISEIVVRITGDLPCSPCGACRQTIIEFGPDALVGFVSDRGETAASIRELLPHAYVKEH